MARSLARSAYSAKAATGRDDSCASDRPLAAGALWITWERHRRTRELCRSLGVDLVELSSRRSSAARYASLLWQTAWCLIRRRPSLLFVQCPSVLLAVMVGALKPLFRYTLVADLHNEAVEPFNYSGAPYRAALGYIQRSADVSVVTNEVLKSIVDRSGGRAFVLPDKVPDMAPHQRDHSDPARAQVVFVCTYAADEPFLEMIEAARLMGPSIDLHVTGDYRRVTVEIGRPDHVHLTGYLPEDGYERLLRNADVIVDLTRMENCLVCGAYEAVALEKPLVTSYTRALRQYFHRGTVYSRHDPASLAESIGHALAHRRTLAAEMTVLKRELSVQWAGQRNALRNILEIQ